MKDNFVTTFKALLKRSMMVLVVIVSISASLSAQYVGKDQAIARLETRSAQIQNAISSMAPTTLNYRYGIVQLYAYKAIYANLLNSNVSVKEAVDAVFATFDSKVDSTSEYSATMAEYTKKNQLTGFDIFQPIKADVKELLK